MRGDRRRPRSPQPVQVLNRGPDLGDFGLRYLLARIRHGEDMDGLPESFESPYLAEDEGLRQAEVAADDVADRRDRPAIESVRAHQLAPGRSPSREAMPAASIAEVWRRCSSAWGRGRTPVPAQSCRDARGRHRLPRRWSPGSELM